MHLRAEGEHVLLELIKENTTAGGIALPDNAKNPNLAKCKVLSVGTGWYSLSGTRIPISFRVGQIVYVQPNPREMELDGKKYVLMNYRDIMLSAEQ